MSMNMRLKCLSTFPLSRLRINSMFFFFFFFSSTWWRPYSWISRRRIRRTTTTPRRRIRRPRTAAYTLCGGGIHRPIPTSLTRKSRRYPKSSWCMRIRPRDRSAGTPPSSWVWFLDLTQSFLIVVSGLSGVSIVLLQVFEGLLCEADFCWWSLLYCGGWWGRNCAC